MGGIASYLWSFVESEPQVDPTPDPTTGLTQRDRDLISESWGVVANKKVLSKNAVIFFAQLFEAYPYIHDRFALFKDQTVSQLRASSKLKAHATSVFYVITSYVENLDDPQTLVGLVEKIAVTHVGRGIPVQDFEDLKIVFLKFLKGSLGSRWTPDTEQAWNKLLSVHNSVYKATEDELTEH